MEVDAKNSENKNKIELENETEGNREKGNKLLDKELGKISANGKRKVVISVSGGLGDMISFLPIFVDFKGVLILSDLYKELFELYGLDIIWWEEGKSEIENILKISFKLHQIHPDFVYGTYPNGRRINILLLLSPGVKIFYDDDNYPVKRFVMPLRFLKSSRPIKIKFPEKKSYRFLNSKLLQVEEKNYFDFKEIPCFREEAEKFAQSKYAVIHPTSRYKTKRWELTKYISLARKILKNDIKIVFVLGKEDEQERMTIEKEFEREIKEGKVKILFGESINKIISYTKRAFFFVGNDSAIGHIAGLSGIKTFVIYGYTRYYHTAPPNSEVIRLDLPCSPCYNFAKGEISVEKECKYNLRCLRELEENFVWERIKNWLEKSSG